MPELRKLGGREYIAEIKARLRDDEAWKVLLAPDLVEKTRWGLTQIINSIDEQKKRVRDDDRWLKTVTSLRRWCKERLDALPVSDLPVVSGSKEAQVWRAFAARLAVVLDDYDPTALENMQAPYGGLTAREWIDAREEKRS